MRRIFFTSVLVVGLLATITAIADIIHLKDGRKMEGQIVSETEDAITLKMDLGEITVKKDDIATIEKKRWTPKEKPPEPEKKPPEPKDEPDKTESKEKPPLPKLFTVDDWIDFEKKFIYNMGSGSGSEEERLQERLRLLTDWKDNYKGKMFLVKAKVVESIEVKRTVITDEGEKPLTVMHVKAEYFDLRTASDPKDQKRAWPGSAPALIYECYIPKIYADSMRAGAFITLTLSFPSSEERSFSSKESTLSTAGFLALFRLSWLTSKRTGTCKRCCGTGFVECAFCAGEGKVPCPKCKGRGRIMSVTSKGDPLDQICGRCKGGDTYLPCEYCGGACEHKCPDCKGTGK